METKQTHNPKHVTLRESCGFDKSSPVMIYDAEIILTEQASWLVVSFNATLSAYGAD